MTAKFLIDLGINFGANRWDIMQYKKKFSNKFGKKKINFLYCSPVAAKAIIPTSLNIYKAKDVFLANTLVNLILTNASTLK